MSKQLGIWEAVADLSTTLRMANRNAKHEKILTIESNLRVFTRVKEKRIIIHATKAIAKWTVMSTIAKQKSYKGNDVELIVFDSQKAFEEAAAPG